MGNLARQISITIYVHVVQLVQTKQFNQIVQTILRSFINFREFTRKPIESNFLIAV